MRVNTARAPATAPGVVTFPSEIDLSNGEEVLCEALELLRSGVHGLVLDLSRCEFCDSSGPNAIFRSQRRADAAGVPMIVVLPRQGIVRRICDITGVTKRIAVAPSLRAALTELKTAS